MILDTICAVALVAKILPACAPPSNAAVGYIEGEYVNVAPIEVARIANEYVRRGDKLKAGDRIATLETADAEIAVRNAAAALAEAKAATRQHPLWPPPRGNRRDRSRPRGR